MIKSVSIKNFQSHRDTYLEFEKGINSIIGSSDSGKTAIIRALLWVFTNRPLGDSIISNWANEVEVRVRFSEDIEIIRKRNKDFNGYILKNRDKQLEFKAIGTDVPEEIKQVINMNSINIQKQFDSPFLLADTPGEVANTFNQVASLDIVGKCIKSCLSELRSLKSEIGYNEKQIENLETQLTEYEFIDKVEGLLAGLEQKEKKRQELEKRLERLSNLKETLVQVRDELKKYKKIEIFERKVNSLIELKKELEQTEQTLKNLENRMEELQRTNEDLKVLKGVDKGLDSVGVYLDKLRELKELENRKVLLEKRAEEYTDLIAETKETTELLSKLKKEFDSLMPDICPLCGQLIKKGVK